jgi:hypothetical protein
MIQHSAGHASPQVDGNGGRLPAPTRLPCQAARHYLPSLQIWLRHQHHLFVVGTSIDGPRRRPIACPATVKYSLLKSRQPLFLIPCCS